MKTIDGEYNLGWYRSPVDMVRIIQILAVVICVLIPVSTSSAQNAVIEGTVLLERPQNASDGVNFGSYGSFSSAGSGSEAGSSSDGIIVWIEDRSKEASYESQDTTIQVLDQVNQQFRPRLMAVRIGQSVRIKNSDPVYHNVFSLSKTKRFDVGRRSPKDYKDVLFDRAGQVDVFCDIHSDMHAVILVLPEQTVAWEKLDGSGDFRFDNIPAGEYTLHFFALDDRTEEIEVTASGSEQVTVGTIRLGAR